MIVEVTTPYKAKVEILEYVPRKVGSRIRDFVAETNLERDLKGLPKINMNDLKDLKEEEAEGLPMDIMIFLEKMNLVVCQNLITSVVVEGGDEPCNMKFFLEMISESDFKKVSEETSRIYSTYIKDVQKKTKEKGTK